MLPTPTSKIDNACDSFDKEEIVVESTLDALMTSFPHNREFTHVHIKVIAISQLYRARVKNIDAEPLARHIWSIPNLDDLLAAGSPRVVGLMHDCETTRSKYYSFATKFCNWHNQKEYSLWDYNVDEALWSYRRQGGFAEFKRYELLDYPRFVSIVKEFREHYGLQRHSLKNIDKFLGRVGAALLQKKRARACENMHGQINSLYTMMEWILGLMITLIIGVGGLLISTLRDRNKPAPKPDPQEAAS
jgi:hypothetical protein